MPRNRVSRLTRAAQVGKLGPAAYQAWVHRPVQGAPVFFSSPVLEAVTKTPWCAALLSSSAGRLRA